MFTTTVAGYDFRVFSFPEKNPDTIKKAYVNTDAESIVLLTPSLTADFSVECYNKDGTVRDEIYLPCVAGYDFLLRKRGLPLDTIEFETPRGMITAERDRYGFCKIRLPKCKQIYTKTIVFFGCNIKFADVFSDVFARVIYCENLELFDRNTIRALMLKQEPVPSIVVVVSTHVGEITLDTYDGHRDGKIPDVLSAIASIYALPHLTRMQSSEYAVTSLADTVLGVDFSGRYLKVRPCR